MHGMLSQLYYNFNLFSFESGHMGRGSKMSQNLRTSFMYGPVPTSPSTSSAQTNYYFCNTPSHPCPLLIILNLQNQMKARGRLCSARDLLKFIYNICCSWRYSNLYFYILFSLPCAAKPVVPQTVFQEWGGGPLNTSGPRSPPRYIWHCKPHAQWNEILNNNEIIRYIRALYIVHVIHDNIYHV